MPIVAISMSESDLDELERLQNEGQFSNRSEVVRHAVHTLMSRHRNIERAAGMITAVVTALYYKKGQGHNISAVQHQYREYLTATIHAHTTEGNCTEVMIIDADADVVRKFLKKLRSQKKVLRVDVNLVGGGH
ncbi:MAG: CopG family ribbon-helix-helix protein [Candidatus Thorarchaeota archaeon]|nr:CopG family ribbon-helix-helix protein [Candidatus Thorarchaeota archaeon]